MATAGLPLSPAQLYTHLPLLAGSRTIRVLDLDLVSVDGNSPLTGQLRVVSLATCPRFTALSYVLGGYSQPRDVITCNEGCRLEITSNCRKALLAVRRYHHTKGGAGPASIWVDTICIDQATESRSGCKFHSWAISTLSPD
ncbi:hypothetical protein B0T14DRAFT_561773 [Immersiella caudata]|uniref:Heterokaryon incompatibility domain-containing protein n=1 Tax=Immersiella caudata TaxID=314043 RepID=A0AA39X1Z2_9PEZI|nr:hypothetical protein B0T14DRAFT_561773 [Immersiella caudata]